MTPAAPPSSEATFAFSTDWFADRERLAACCDLFGRGMVNLDITALPDISFYTHMSIRVMPDLVIATGRGSAHECLRTRELLADGSDSLVVHIASCQGAASQLGRDVSVPAGDAVVLSTADVGGFTFGAEQSVLLFRVPRATLGPFLHDPDSVLVRTVPKENAALRLLTAYVASLDHEQAPASEDRLQRLAASHVHDLVALALGATRDAAETARTRGVRAARLNAAKTFVMRRLGKNHLSAGSVAAHLGVTPRYVYMLFEAEGLSFSEFVLAQRLMQAHRMLGAPRHSGETISEIAYAAGFGDLSHFNRSFRRRYGCTPSDVRAAHRGGGRGGELP
jgi:AraC-like DNA-binding protein